MSSTNGNGVGNLIITYKFKREGVVKQVAEEAELKTLIANLLRQKGYKFSIADDEIIDERLLMEKRNFLNEVEIEEYRNKFIKLPPAIKSKERIKTGLAEGIPLEFFVDVKIVTEENLSRFEFEKELAESFKDCLDRSNRL